MSGYEALRERNRIWHEWLDARTTAIPVDVIRMQVEMDAPVLTAQHDGDIYLVRGLAQAGQRERYAQIPGLRIGRFQVGNDLYSPVVMLPLESITEHDRTMATAFFGGMKRAWGHTAADSEREINAAWYDAAWYDDD